MPRPRLSRAIGASVALHAGLLLVLTLFITRSEPVATQVPPQKLNVFYMSGPPGSGGGRPTPPRSSPPARELPTPIPMTVEIVPPVAPPTERTPVLDAPVTAQISGLILSGSPGANPFAGTPGNGPGGSPGAGPGGKGGPGDDPKGSGAGLVFPSLERSVEPLYTNDALAARIQGTVQLEAVVLADGTVGRVRVTRSLDSKMGLDDAAIAAAKKWLFRPATQQGRPVDVVVTLYLEFRIH